VYVWPTNTDTANKRREMTMNRNSRLHRHTAVLCVFITLLLGVSKALASNQQGRLTLPDSEQPVPFTQQECSQLVSLSSEPTLADLQCGDDSADVVLGVLAVFFICCLVAAAAAADTE
jgi:hypothetical protein